MKKGFVNGPAFVLWPPLWTTYSATAIYKFEWITPSRKSTRQEPTALPASAAAHDLRASVFELERPDPAPAHQRAAGGVLPWRSKRILLPSYQ
jgi:hypothetical protein